MIPLLGYLRLHERQRAEAAKQESDRLYYELINEAPDPIIMLGPKGHVASLNRAAEVVSGCAASELVGKHFAEAGIVGAASIPRSLQEFVLVLAGQARPPFDLDIVQKDKRHRIMEVHPRLVRTGARVSGVQMILRDVTERRRMEQQQRQQAETLEQANRELALREQLMRSLMEDLQATKTRLEDQKALLEGTNSRLKELAILKDEFVAKVSHELRTPLTSIKEGLSLLLDEALGPTSPDQQDFLRTMDGDIDRLTELINNMLDISKIEAGRMRLNRTRLNLQRLVESLLRSYKPLLGSRAVQVECDQAPPVFADEHRMLQILANFLSNAIKVTAEEGGRIGLRATSRDSMVALTVEDNGPGIPREELPKLFQKFSQGGQQQDGRPRGTGLGLVVCKELAELHGGRIDVDSAVGRGTAFSVWLPTYTDAVALMESARELRLLNPLEEGQAIGLIAIQTQPPLEGVGGRRQERQLDHIAEDVKKHVHRGDLVLALEPSWVVVLAVIHPEDARAIIRRLRQTLVDGAQLQYGVAVSPADGEDGVTLYERAKTRLGQWEADPVRNI